MRIQPRQQILEVWKSIAAYSQRHHEWSWGGRDGRNSICDAEQLLAVLYPATEVLYFRLNDPDETAEDVLSALHAIGDSVDIPKLLIEAVSDYMDTYTRPDGTPIFSGGSYFRALCDGDELTDEQRDLDVVDSYATSLSLALSTMRFLKVYSRSVTKPATKKRIAELETQTSRRLSAAMVGLLRSFTVNVFPAESVEGESLCRLLNQQNLTNKAVLEMLHTRLESLRASLKDTTLGLGEVDGLEKKNMLFECGWSWGVAEDAPLIETVEHVGEQPNGIALSAPFLYFTVVALDAIADLNDNRARIDGLLNAEQRRLAEALALRWSITLEYWSTLARFGGGDWPLEDIPWRAVDGVESVYFSLAVTAVVLQDLLNRRATDDDLTRTVQVLENLAVLGKIKLNRPMGSDDSAAGLHTPGVPLDLVGGDKLGPQMCWTVADFAAVLMKRSVQAAGLSRNGGARDRLYTLAEDALGHLWRRRVRTGPAAGLWDDPSEVVPGPDTEQTEPSWYMTKRVIDCLTEAVKTINQPPIRSARLTDLAPDLLSEADHLFSQYRLASSAGPGAPVYTELMRIEHRLQRARQLIRDRPASACSLAVDVLSDLDALTVVRQDAEGSR
ncbi:MAG: SCO2524 family protein [Kibdelosporangium sp.]